MLCWAQSWIGNFFILTLLNRSQKFPYFGKNLDISVTRSSLKLFFSKRSQNMYLRKRWMHMGESTKKFHIPRFNSRSGKQVINYEKVKIAHLLVVDNSKNCWISNLPSNSYQKIISTCTKSCQLLEILNYYEIHFFYTSCSR